MTVYINKKNEELNTDQVESGTAYATYAPYAISSRGGEHDFRYWLYPLGQSLDYTDDFFGRIYFETPHLLPVDDFINFGFCQLAGAGSNNILSVRYNRIDLTNGSQITVTGPGGSTDTTSSTETLASNTKYYIDIYYNSSSRVLFGKIYKASDDSLIVNLSVTTTEDFVGIDHIGIFSIESVGTPFGNQYAGDFKITEVHANSSTSYEAPFEGAVDTDWATGQVQIRQPNTSDYTDITTKIDSIKIEREFNAVDLANINVLNAEDTNLSLLTPNTRVRVRLGFGEEDSHFTFIGYIPPHPDYCNVCSIQGKNRTFKRENDIILYGIAHHIIPPASDDYEDAQDDTESSEQEDMYKAQRYCEVNNNPEFPFGISEEIIEVKAYAYTNKLQAEYFFFDDVDNLDNMGCFAAAALLHDKLSESDIGFGGGLFDPDKYLGDTKGDWATALEILDKKIMSRLEKEDSLPAKPRRYFWMQSNHGAIETVIAPYPDLEDLPTIIKTVSETEILEIRRSSGKYAVDFIDGLWIDLGDVIYLDTDEYSLKGYYVVAKLDYLWSVGNVNITVYLDRPARVA